MEQPLVPGEESISGAMVVGVGDTTAEAVDKVGRLAAGIAKDEGALGIWSIDVEVRSSRPPEAVTGTEASRAEVGTKMLSEAVVLGAGPAVTDRATEAGADTVETGGEVAAREGQGGEAIEAKDSALWDRSLSTATERNTRLVSVMLANESC